MHAGRHVSLTWVPNVVVCLPYLLRGSEVPNHLVGLGAREYLNETSVERNDQEVYEICSGLPKRRHVGTRVLHRARSYASCQLSVTLTAELFCNIQCPSLVNSERPEGMEDVRTAQDETKQLHVIIQLQTNRQLSTTWLL